MRTFRIPVSWEVTAFVNIEAETLEQAVEIFDITEDEIALPTDPEYIDGSFRREESGEWIATYNE